MTLAFDQLFQNSPNAYMVLDRELRYLEANRAYELLVGVTRDQLIGHGLFELFPGERNVDGTSQADILRASLERTLLTGERDVLALIPYAIESDTPDGRVVDMRFWSATHTPVRDATGAVVAVMQHTTDVTEVHRLREEVRRAREATGLTAEQAEEGVLSRAAAVQRDNVRLSARLNFLTDLFAQAPGFMAVLRGPQHVFELANEAYETLVGREGVVGRAVREALPDIEGQGFFELLDQVRDTGRPFVGRGVPVQIDTGAGSRTSYVDFIYQPIRDASGQVEGIFVQGADVTDRETALAALREGEARFRTIADMVPQMVWSTLPDGHHDYYNQRWYDYTGMAAGATDGENWNAVFHPDDQPRAWALWRESLATGRPYEIEYRLRHQSGEYRWVLGRALPVRDRDGRIVRWMGTCTDIHEHKRLQEMLVSSEHALREADAQKDRFLALLAHELRNPLAPIGMAAQLLKNAPDRVDTVQRAAQIIERQAEHMRHLVEDLLDVSRVTRGQVALQRAPVRVADVVAAAVEQTAPLVATRNHRLEVVEHARELWLDADATRLTQVLANVLTNAAKYTPPGGRITLEVERDASSAVLRVSDTGVGMAPELLRRAFQLFAQAETTPERYVGGLGLGLPLARSLVELHGGTLEARSEGSGHGSTFELRLPLAEGLPNAAADVASLAGA